MYKKKMSRRRLLRLMGLGVAGTTLLAACEPEVVEKEVTKEVEKVVKEEVEVEKEVTRVVEKEAGPAPEDVVTIQLHLRAGGDESEPAIYVHRPEEFMEEHPEIEVELAPIPGGEYDAKVQTMAAAGNLGDVMWTSDCRAYHSRLVRQDLIASVDDWLAANDHSKDEWVDAAVESLTYEGEMHGLPKCSHPSTSMVWLNERMIQEAGFDVPERYGNNHADVLSWAEAMAQGPEGDREVYGYFIGGAGVENNYSNLRSFGGWELNEEGTESLLNSDEAWEWAQWTNHTFRTGLNPHAEVLPSGGVQALFAAEKLPMIAAGRWMHKRIVAAVEEAGNPFEFRVLQAPREEYANGWINCVDTHSTTTFTDHPEESNMLAYALADQRFAELVALDAGYLTARVDDKEVVDQIGSEILQVQYENMMLEEPIRQPENTRGEEAQTVLTNELQAIWLGDKELTRDAMEEVKAAIDSVLEKGF